MSKKTDAADAAKASPDTNPPAPLVSQAERDAVIGEPSPPADHTRTVKALNTMRRNALDSYHAADRRARDLDKSATAAAVDADLFRRDAEGFEQAIEALGGVVDRYLAPDSE